MKTEAEIIEINKKQKEFYNHKKKNLPTRIWSFVREKTLKQIRRDIGVLNQSYDLHKEWFGDLTNKKVLDLGCFSGNNLSFYLAENSKEYIGLDLSDLAIAKLNERLKDIPSAKAIAADFLSETDFPDKDFDVIYAYGVLHHFQNPDVLIKKLNDKLAPGGIIVSYDPLETSLPIKIIRTIYRPFQSDKDWEWPFTRKTYYKFHNTFKVIERHGVLGQAKWYFLINLLPMSDVKKQEIGKKWHKKDWELSATSDSHMFRCMQLTMVMQKK
jgi:SAM-dependent methyltransferase